MRRARHWEVSWARRNLAYHVVAEGLAHLGPPTVVSVWPEGPRTVAHLYFHKTRTFSASGMALYLAGELIPAGAAGKGGTGEPSGRSRLLPGKRVSRRR